MSYTDRIKEARLNAGMTQEQLANAVGVAKSTITSYEKGNRSISAGMVGKIAEATGASIDFIFQDEQAQPADNDELTSNERNLMKKYRALDERGKAMIDYVLDYAKHQTDEFQKLQESVRFAKEEYAAEIIDFSTIPFRRSLQPASAGTGMYLGPDEFETIYVQENEWTSRASFGIPVRGDSMEPDYHDGDILLVEQAEDIRIGDVGVFTIDGEGYVKERGNGELISLNPEYAPIPMNETVRCNGRVIGILEPEWIVEK